MSVIDQIVHDLNEQDEMSRRLGLPSVCARDQLTVLIHMAEATLDDIVRYGEPLEVRVKGLIAEAVRWLEATGDEA